MTRYTRIKPAQPFAEKLGAYLAAQPKPDSFYATLDAISAKFSGVSYGPPDMRPAVVRLASRMAASGQPVAVIGEMS